MHSTGTEPVVVFPDYLLRFVGIDNRGAVLARYRISNNRLTCGRWPKHNDGMPTVLYLAARERPGLICQP